MKKITPFPPVAIAEATEPHQLNTMQRNALCRLFGRKEFTAEEVARLDYAQVKGLPKIGSKGFAAIQAWLKNYGYDLSNQPLDHKPTIQKRLNFKLDNAARLLTRHGYRIEPPLS